MRRGALHELRPLFLLRARPSKLLRESKGARGDGGWGNDRAVAVAGAKTAPGERTLPRTVALVETLAIGCHAVNRGNPAANESVLIIGAGPIGLSVSEFARLSGAKTIVMDLSQPRLRFVSEKMGIPDTILSTGDGSEQDYLLRINNGVLPDLVIDATGNHQSMGNALNYCGFTGRVVYVGITQADVSFPHAPVMHRRELTIMASRNALPDDFTRIIRLIQEEESIHAHGSPTRPVLMI